MTELATTCEVYRQQVHKFTEMLTRIRSVHDWNIGLTEDDFDDLDLKARAYPRVNCDPHYRVAVAGGYSAGKSELLNALIGAPVLPTDIRDTTFVPTVIRKSKDGQRRNSVRYLTQEEISELLLDYSRRLDSGKLPITVDGIRQSPESVLDKALNELAEQKSVHTREVEDLKNLFNALRNPEFDDYIRIQHPHNRPIKEEEVRALVIRDNDNLERYLAASVIIDVPDFPFSDEVELIDLPGTDAGDRWAKQVTHRFVQDVDMLMLVVKADATFGDAAQDLFITLRDWVGGHTERLFVVVNKTDLYHGFDPTSIEGAYSQLLEGIRRSIPEYEPSVIYVSAAANLPDSDAHENALKGIGSIAETSLPELNRLLSHVGDGGGVAAARDVINDFLNGPAFNVKIRKMQLGWEQLYDCVSSKIVTDVMDARSLMTNDRETMVRRCRESLERLESSFTSTVEELREEAELVMKTYDAAFFKTLGLDLLTDVEKIRGAGVEAELADHEAHEVARNQWPPMNENFRSLVFAASEGLVDSFGSKWQDCLKPSLDRLLAFQACVPGHSAPPVPGYPYPKLVDSLMLRMHELVPQSTDGSRPYPQPVLGQKFGPASDPQGYSNRFYRSVQACFSSRIDKSLADLRGVVGIYVHWHLDRFLESAKSYVQFGLEYVATAESGRFDKFLQSTEDRKAAERSRQIVEVGELHGQLNRQPGTLVASA